MAVRRATKLERDFQGDLIKELRDEIFPGSLVLKNDSALIQGIPDLTILFGNRYAILEVKKSADEEYQPNQEWYLDQVYNWGAFSATIYPENKTAVLTALIAYFN